MKANEARELTRKKILDESNKEIESVYDAIKSAIEDGAYRCHYYKKLSSATLETLEKDGYKVESIYDPRDCDYTYSIIWAELVEPEFPEDRIG